MKETPEQVAKRLFPFKENKENNIITAAQRTGFIIAIQWQQSHEAEYKKITGFNNSDELAAYEKGRQHEENTIVSFIEKWNGETNSVLGDLLFNKVKKEAIKFTEWTSKEEYLRGIGQETWFDSKQDQFADHYTTEQLHTKFEEWRKGK